MTPEALFHSLQTKVLGLDRTDEVRTLAGGTAQKRRVYLDTTATALMPELVWDGLRTYFATSTANSHTEAHRAGRATTQSIEEARLAVGRLVGAVEHDHVSLFTGNGATGAINYLARALFPPELRMPVRRCPEGPPQALVAAIRAAFPQGSRALDALLERPLVISTLMEHHSNILPWVEAVGHHNVRFVRVLDDGRLDLAHLRSILDDEGRRVRIVAVSGASNVTGIVNPIHEIAEMAHKVGAQIAVDAAQLAPHRRIDMNDIDFLVISGHKLYAPGSRGVLVGRLQVLEARRCVGDVGGGMVEYVSLDDFRVKDEVTSREEAGTPNIPGTITLGLVASALLEVGMDRVAKHEAELVGYSLDRLCSQPGITVYGTHEPAARVGVFSVNVEGVPHSLAAAFLDDYFNIAVRNACFCAQPYVKVLLGVGADQERALQTEMLHGDRRHVPGMVRLSLGIYSTREDIDVAVEALTELWKHRDAVSKSYEATLDGGHRLKGAVPEPVFLPSHYVAAQA